jgi:hypothetical protein
MLKAPFIILAAAVLSLVGYARADSPFNVDVFWGWDYCYRPMEWTPVVIGISSTLTEPFQGSVNISAHQDGLNTLNVTHRFVLTPDLPMNLPLVTKLAFAVDRCAVRIVELPGGKTRWYNNFDLMDFSSRERVLTPVADSDLFVGLVGHQRFALGQLPSQALCQSHYGSGKVHLAYKMPQTVPWDWTGFACLDLLILYDPDWTLFNKYHLDAIAQWVSNGGKLLLILGANPLPPDSPIAPLLPCDFQEPRQTTISGETLAKWNLDPARAEDVTVWPLRLKPDVVVCRPEMDDEVCLFVVGSAGFGRAAVLAFDPSTFSGAQTAHAGRFWVNRIAAVLAHGETTPTSALESSQDQSRTMTRCPLTGDQIHPDRSDGGIQLTLGGLETGKYRMVSYHNKPTSQHSPIDIYVDDVLRARRVHQSQVLDDSGASRAYSEFEVAAGNDVKVEFRPISSSSENQRAMLCGFELLKLRAAQDDKPGDDIEERTLAVDFGASGQPVMTGFTGLGSNVNDRQAVVKFDESNGLPAGLTVTVRPTNPKDDLQFCPNPGAIVNPRRQRRTLPPNFAAGRTIEFVQNAQTALDARDQHMYQVGGAQAASNDVMEYLYSISEMRPLSIWWVILLLAALAVLLGPVDYTILKRRDRLPLTWLTCSVWIALFTGGAYYGVQALRGGKMQARVVSVLDAIADEQCAWSTVYCGLFAPKSDDYGLEGLQENQWWSGVAPTEEALWDYRRETGTRNIYCTQQDGYNHPYSLPINIWTMQCLLNESPAPDFPFTAALTNEADQLVVNIVNRSDSPILKGYVILDDDRVLDFEKVGAFESRRVAGRPRRRSSWIGFSPQSRPGTSKYEMAFFARGSLQRTDAIKEYLARGAAVVCVQYDNADVPFEVKDRNCAYHHIQLARLVVFPKQEKEPQNDPNQKPQ